MPSLFLARGARARVATRPQRTNSTLPLRSSHQKERSHGHEEEKEEDEEVNGAALPRLEAAPSAS
jgi:hypothetical protein